MVSERVYEELKRMKEKGESFSDVIERLLKRRPRLADVAGSGTISIKEWERVKEAFKSQEALDELRRKYLLGLIGK